MKKKFVAPFLFSYLKKLSFLLFLLFLACKGEGNPNKLPLNNFDLPGILKRGKLKVLIENSSQSFFIYKGKKMGFEYEILQSFAEELGVEIETIIVNDLDEIPAKIAEHEGEIVACNLSVTNERKASLNFSEPYLKNPQVLIQRKQNDSLSKNGTAFITDPLQLAKKKIDVWQNSSYFSRLQNLMDEIGDSIYIRTSSGHSSVEEFIEMVSTGEIDYTIADKSIAQINENFYDNLDCSVKISFNQNIAFGLGKDAPLLRQRLNKWLKKYFRTPQYAYLKKRYFENVSVPTINSESFASTKGKICPFDQILKLEAGKKNLDWRFVAAIISKESNFNPTIQGFGGAYGLMQFMPGTGPSFGVHPTSTPEVQIRGGVKYIKKLEMLYSNIPDNMERMKFVLASYNAGPGHVLDAQNLAKKHGKNPTLWEDNVAFFFQNLNKSEYYRDAVVKTGMYRGGRAIKYVQVVMEKYKLYKQLAP